MFGPSYQSLTSWGTQILLEKFEHLTFLHGPQFPPKVDHLWVKEGIGSNIL